LPSPATLVSSRKKRDSGQPFCQQATKHLADLVLNKTVDVKGYGSDRYGRVLGVIALNGKNNMEMVRAGYAEVYRGKPPHGFDQSPYLNATGNQNKNPLSNQIMHKGIRVLRAITHQEVRLFSEHPTRNC
jgi:endonuclease YncB( thermonuclease family)